MAYCIRELPLAAQLLITEFRQHFLDIAQLRAAGGTPCARALRRVRWQNRRFHPNRRYNRTVDMFYDSSGVWRLRSDHPSHMMFIIHDIDTEPGHPLYGRAVRVAQIELYAPPTDDYEDDDHFSFGWRTDDDEPRQLGVDYYH